MKLIKTFTIFQTTLADIDKLKQDQEVLKRNYKDTENSYDKASAYIHALELEREIVKSELESLRNQLCEKDVELQRKESEILSLKDQLEHIVREKNEQASQLEIEAESLKTPKWYRAKSKFKRCCKSKNTKTKE